MTNYTIEFTIICNTPENGELHVSKNFKLDDNNIISELLEVIKSIEKHSNIGMIKNIKLYYAN